MGSNPTRELDVTETGATTKTENQTRLKQGQQPHERARRDWNKGNNPYREPDDTETVPPENQTRLKQGQQPTRGRG